MEASPREQQVSKNDNPFQNSFENLHLSLLQYLEDNNFTSSAQTESLIYSHKDLSYIKVLHSRLHNLRFASPTTHKALFIVTPSNKSQIRGTIIWAKQQHYLQMKIRGGGHDYEGLSYVNKSNVPFFILDMINFRSIDVDTDEETAWVQTGTTLGELCYRIAEKSNIHGFPVGVCPTVGVGGHFSGAGYGNMMRKYGLTTDNVIDAEIVDVNGRVLNRESMGEDLFWAIRGGGGSSFGVVVSYKIKIVRVPEKVTVFRVSRMMDENAIDTVLQWQEIASTIDRDLFIRLIMDVVNGSSGEKTVRAMFIALFLGDSERLMSLMKSEFPKLNLSESDCYEMSWVESVLFWADFEIGTPNEVLLERAPKSLSHLTRKSDYVKKPIPKEGIQFIWEKMIELKTPRITFNPYGGRMSEIRGEETPFPHRNGNLFKIQYLTNWDEQGKEKESYYLDLTRKLYRYMSPYVSNNPRQSYYNYRDLDLGLNHHDGPISYLEGLKYGTQYFMENFHRLVKVKMVVDPQNFFRNEQSVPTFPI